MAGGPANVYSRPRKTRQVVRVRAPRRLAADFIAVERRVWVQVVSAFWAAFVLSSVVCLVLGYIAGRVDRLGSAQPAQPVTPQWHSKARPASDQQLTANQPKIEIESSKVVTKLDTSDIQKPENVTLGTVTTKQEDINGAASRLAQMKGR